MHLKGNRWVITSKWNMLKKKNVHETNRHGKKLIDKEKKEDGHVGKISFERGEQSH